MLPTSLCQFSRLVGRERPGGFPKQRRSQSPGVARGVWRASDPLFRAAGTMFSGEVPERPAGPGPRGEGRRDRVLHHRGGGMIEFGDAFLALNVIPQAATTGARGRRHAADRQPWDVRKEFIVSARRAPRRHPVCTTLLRTEAQAGPQAINQIRVAAGFRARAQLQAVRVGNRFPCRLPPTKNEYLGRTQARLGGEQWRSGRRFAATCPSCPRRARCL